MNWSAQKSPIEEIQLPLLKEKKVNLFMLREDLLHPEISGNKYRKLKYNILNAKSLGYSKILTFGGAFSNHIAATAAAARLNNLQAVGIIRGEEIEKSITTNPTLNFAYIQGMKFKFISREDYRKKDSEEFLEQLKLEFPDFYIIPEGGTNDLAIKGCEEILYEDCNQFEYITAAIGTGGTIAGLINASKSNQKILGFSALKGDFIINDVSNLTIKRNFNIFTNYHFGGYGKFNDELIDFINDFKEITKIPLDPVYTGKMMYGIMDLIKYDYFPLQAKILAIHTGGLQGIEGVNKKLAKRNKVLIK